MSSPKPPSTPEERFAAATIAYGGRFDGATLPGWVVDLLRDLVDGYRHRLRESAARVVEPQAARLLASVHVDYVANSSPNALIVPDPGGPLLGTFVGLPLAMLDAACRVLRDPALVRLSPDDVALPEPAFDDGTAALFAFVHRPEARPDYRPFTAVPADPARRRVAAVAFGLAMDFVFEHEMAHLLQGHVEHAGGGGPVRLWQERLSLDDDDRPAPAWRQPCEVDADATAVGLVLGRRLGEPEADDSTGPGGHGQLLRVWLLSLGLLIRILDPRPRPFPSTAAAGYPHPFTRLLNLIQVTAEAVRRFAPDAEPLLPSLLMLAADDDARVARHAGLPEGLLAGLSRHQAEARAEAASLHRRISVLEPTLRVARQRMYDRSSRHADDRDRRHG